MANIGGVNCIFVNGNIRALKEVVHTWRVPGMDGFNAQLMGKGDSDFTFRGTLIGSLAAIETWSADLEDLQGTVISILDSQSTTYSDLLLTRVGKPRKIPRVDTDGNGDTIGEVTVEGIVVE